MGMTRRHFGLAAALSAILVLGSTVLNDSAARAESATGPVVFAAASLKNALDDAAAGRVKAGHAAPKVSYAASNVLAKQIEEGAPADLFFSADLDWMAYANKEGHHPAR